MQRLGWFSTYPSSPTLLHTLHWLPVAARIRMFCLSNIWKTTVTLLDRINSSFCWPHLKNIHSDCVDFSLAVNPSVWAINSFRPEQVLSHLHGSGSMLCICLTTHTPSLSLSGSLPPFGQSLSVSLSLWSVRKLLKWEMSLRKLVVLIKLWHKEWQEAMKRKQ